MMTSKKREKLLYIYNYCGIKKIVQSIRNFIIIYHKLLHSLVLYKNFRRLLFKKEMRLYTVR